MDFIARRYTSTTVTPVQTEATSLSDFGHEEPQQGVYTVARTYPGLKVLLPDAHIERLKQSAKLAGIGWRLDMTAVSGALRTMIEQSGFALARFRISVPADAPDTALLSAERFHEPDPALRRDGVAAGVAVDGARQDARAKTLGWMHQRQSLTQQQAVLPYETLLTDEAGAVLEGMTSNFYAIHDGALYTAGDGVLEGISRRIVLATAPDVLPLHQQAVHVDMLPSLDEAFLTSSTRGIIPVVRIEGEPIGDGTPGPLTRRLIDAYEQYVQTHLEPL